MKKLIYDNEVYLSFLESPKMALRSRGIELAADVSENLLSDFCITIDRAREIIHKGDIGDEKPSFEDIFHIPIITIADDNLFIDNVGIYRTTPHSESNRGSVTDFSAGMTPTTNTDHWTTTTFETDSIFRDWGVERFIRTPFLGAETLTQIIKSVH